MQRQQGGIAVSNSVLELKYRLSFRGRMSLLKCYLYNPLTTWSSLSPFVVKTCFWHKYLKRITGKNHNHPHVLNFIVHLAQITKNDIHTLLKQMHTLSLDARKNTKINYSGITGKNACTLIYYFCFLFSRQFINFRQLP